jgi:hypothetical protein
MDIRETSPNNKDSYKPGGYYGICDECGFKFRFYELKKRWDKQESLRGKKEKIGVPVARPEGTDTYITTPITQDDL